MRTAIVGCGFVADYYMRSLRAYPQLEIVAAMDIQPERARGFCAYHVVPTYTSLPDLFKHHEIDLVINLTNPRSHFDVSRDCLMAGKHVYSEKPLALSLERATELVQLAATQGLHLACAPCSLMSETAQTLWKALREDIIGPVRVVYAELDDGLLHRMPYRQWVSDSGLPWPYQDEFEVGCTLEHAAYYVSWLAAFFGPITQVTAFASCQVPDKQTDVPLTVTDTPDFSVACLQFTSGVVARLTCSIVAPHHHGLMIVGEDGILGTDDCWFYRSPVYVRRQLTFRRKSFMTPWRQPYCLVKSPQALLRRKKGQQMDYARGIADLADGIKHQRSPYLTADFSLHVNEAVLAIHSAARAGRTYPMTTTFSDLKPLPWAL